MKNLFTYGSLMFEKVWLRVVGTPRESASGKVAGVKRFAVKGASYPGMVESTTESTVEGVVYFDLADEDLVLLDRFEGACYKRCSVTCELDDGRIVAAFCYFFRDRFRYLLADRAWDVEAFEREGIRSFLR